MSSDSVHQLQEQKIQLARAIYSDSNVYFLDDPLSAVDAHTTAIPFNECVMVALAHKTVILATHQVEFLPEVDKILVMETGQKTQSGSYEELLTSGTTFEQLVNAHKNAVTVLEFSNDEQVEPQKLDQNLLKKSHGSLSTKENGKGEISMKGLPGVQLTEEKESRMYLGIQHQQDSLNLVPGWHSYMAASMHTFFSFCSFD